MKQFIPDLQFNIIKINVNRKYLLKQRGKEYKCSVSVLNGNNNYFPFSSSDSYEAIFLTTLGTRNLEPFHQFEVDHNAPCFPPTSRITFVSYLSRVLSEEKSKTMVPVKFRK